MILAEGVVVPYNPYLTHRAVNTLIRLFEEEVANSIFFTEVVAAAITIWPYRRKRCRL